MYLCNVINVFSFALPDSVVEASAWEVCGASVKGQPGICSTFRVNNMVRNYIKYTTEKT